MGFILFLLTQYVFSLSLSFSPPEVHSSRLSSPCDPLDRHLHHHHGHPLLPHRHHSLPVLQIRRYRSSLPSTLGVKDNILNSFPTTGALGVILNLAMMVTVVGGFPLWMEPVNETVEGDDVEHGKWFIKTPKYVILRTVEVCAMSLIAGFVPRFGTVVGLIGNFTDVLTTFTFPAVMHFVFFRNKTSPTIIYLDLGQLVLSVIIMIICTSLSLKEFMNS